MKKGSSPRVICAMNHKSGFLFAWDCIDFASAVALACVRWRTVTTNSLTRRAIA